MKKIIIILLILLTTGCSFKANLTINESTQSKIESSSEVETSMKIKILEEEYTINLENNKTVSELDNMLPLDLEMNELNGNEKYVYLDSNLPTNSVNVKHINKGDVMLFGNNCLVIFYESFDTPYSYTKIGHIDNLPDLGSEDISVYLTK